MTDASPPRRGSYWTKHTDGAGNWRNKEGPPGADLAALRRGLGREPGTVPEMWRFYTTLDDNGALTRALRAEHAALTLFALHQQSQAHPMHRAGIGLGAAVRDLHAGKDAKFSQEAVNRRFAAAATATSMAELTLHLRGLVSQLRVIGRPLDYDRLFRDLLDWQRPENVGRVRRRWGSGYFVWTAEPDEPADLSA